MKTRLLIIPIIVVSAILAVLVYDSISLDKLCADDGGKRIGDTCFIPIITNSTKDTQTLDMSLIKTMKPNSMEWFYYPNNTKTKDTYRLFMLIRLPEWMGGDANDTSAFRAYSAKSIDDPCPVKYWADEGRQRIENPCQGSMYRVIDGVMNTDTLPTANRMMALPHLDLSSDENGFLYIEPPKWTKTENGVIGYGKEVTPEEIQEGSSLLIKSFEKSYPDMPAIPLEFGGYTLSEMLPKTYGVSASYFDFPSRSDHISITISKLSLGFVTTNLAQSNSEFWQIGNTIIKIGGSALDKNSDRPESVRYYTIEFNNGVNFRVEGKNLEFMKQEIVKNYFPEYKYDDLFLISKNN